MPKVLIYKLISKKVLKNIQLEFNSDELLKKAQLECITNKENAKVVSDFLPNPFSKIEKNQNRDNIKNLQLISTQEKRSKKTGLNIVRKEVKPHQENIRKRYLKSSSKNSSAPKNSGLTKYVTEKKEEVRILQDEIKELEDKLRKINNQRNRQNTIFSLKESIRTKKDSIEKIFDFSHVKVIRSNDEFSNKADLEINKVFKKCPHCLVSILDKNLLNHIKAKCPKRPIILDSQVSQEFKSGDTKLVVEYMSWQLLPKGEWLFRHLSNHFKHLNSTKKWKNKFFDKTRFQKIEKNLYPNKCFIGKDEFEGYVVYCFDWTSNVVLECPIYGNAIYIIKQGNYTWQEIAKSSKWQARTEHSEQVTVINHSETWLERLKKNLRHEL